MREDFDGIFFAAGREGVDRLVRAATGLAERGCKGASVVATAFGGAGGLVWVAGAVLRVVYSAEYAQMLTSGGSEDGGSEPMFGLSGVRKGDLNGFFKVLAASFSLRRLACGVDILDGAAALRVLRCQVRGRGPRQGERVCLDDACLTCDVGRRGGARCCSAPTNAPSRACQHDHLGIVSIRLGKYELLRRGRPCPKPSTEVVLAGSCSIRTTLVPIKPSEAMVQCRHLGAVQLISYCYCRINMPECKRFVSVITRLLCANHTTTFARLELQ